MNPIESFPAEQVVRDPRAAALLVDGRRNRFLRPFLGRPCGVTEAARSLGVSPSLVSYWVTQFGKAGLLVPARRPGSRAKVYRSVADAFVVALRDVPLDNEDAILDAQMDGWVTLLKQSLLRTARRHAGEWQFRMQMTPQGVRETLMPAGGSLADVPLVNERGGLNLNADDAAALRADLHALIRRYTARSAPEQTPGHQRTLVWLVAVDAPRER